MLSKLAERLFGRHERCSEQQELKERVRAGTTNMQACETMQHTLAGQAGASSAACCCA